MTRSRRGRGRTRRRGGPAGQASPGPTPSCLPVDSSPQPYPLPTPAVIHLEAVSLVGGTGPSHGSARAARLARRNQVREELVEQELCQASPPSLAAGEETISEAYEASNNLCTLEDSYYVG